MEQRDDILERISAMEVQIKDIGEIKTKLDSLYSAIMDMKLNALSERNAFSTKADCIACRGSLESRMMDIENSRKKLFWASVSTGLVLVAWLLEQLMHVSLKIGG